MGKNTGNKTTYWLVVKSKRGGERKQTLKKRLNKFGTHKTDTRKVEKFQQSLEVGLKRKYCSVYNEAEMEGTTLKDIESCVIFIKIGKKIEIKLSWNIQNMGVINSNTPVGPM